MVPRVRSTPRIKPIRFMRHLVSLDFHPRRIKAFELPSFRAHVTVAEQRDGTIAFTRDDAVVNETFDGVRGVDGDVDFAQGVEIFAIEVGSLCRFSDAVEAVDFEVRSQGETGFERVHPFAGLFLVVRDFGRGVCDAVRVILQDLPLVPRFCCRDQVV